MCECVEDERAPPTHPTTTAPHPTAPHSTSSRPTPAHLTPITPPFREGSQGNVKDILENCFLVLKNGYISAALERCPLGAPSGSNCRGAGGGGGGAGATAGGVGSGGGGGGGGEEGVSWQKAEVALYSMHAVAPELKRYLMEPPRRIRSAAQVCCRPLVRCKV